MITFGQYSVFVPTIGPAKLITTAAAALGEQARNGCRRGDTPTGAERKRQKEKCKPLPLRCGMAGWSKSNVRSVRRPIVCQFLTARSSSGGGVQLCLRENLKITDNREISMKAMLDTVAS